MIYCKKRVKSCKEVHMKEISMDCKICINEYNFTQNRTNDSSSGSCMHYIGRLKKGSARLVSERGTLELECGDVFYIPKGLKYVSHWFVTDTAVTFDSFGFSEFVCLENKRFALQKIEADETVISLIDEISSQRALYQNSLKISSLFLGLLSEILPRMIEDERADKSSTLAEKAIFVMRRNPFLDIPSVAAACSVSESGLYAAFRQSGYKTPNDERQRILVDRAKNLLISTDEPIESISAELGFSSSSYFRKIFCKFTGKAPSQVRRESFI